MRLRRFSLLFCGLLAAASASALAAHDGDLDASFGVDGRTVLFGEQGFNTDAATLAPDGKIVLLGEVSDRLYGSFVVKVIRLGADGALDASFGDHGVASVPQLHFGRAVQVQPDGKILILGPDFSTFRLQNDGTPDFAYGREGLATIGFTAGAAGLPASHPDAHAMAVQADGAIVLAGGVDFARACGPDDTVQNTAAFGVARLRPDGSVDRSFGRGGQALIDYSDAASCQHASAKAITVDPFNRIVIGGTLIDSTPPLHSSVSKLGLARLTADGLPDPSFNKSGSRVLGFHAGAAGERDSLSALALQSDGKIVLAGAANPDGGLNSYDFGAARVLNNGALDSGFGSKGIAVVPFNADSAPVFDASFGLLVQTDGRIVLGGGARALKEDDSTDVDFALLRLDPDGSIDRSFGVDGRSAVSFDLGADNDDMAMSLSSVAGGLVLVGYADSPTFGSRVPMRNFAIARVLNQVGRARAGFELPKR